MVSRAPLRLSQVSRTGHRSESHGESYATPQRSTNHQPGPGDLRLQSGLNLPLRPPRNVPSRPHALHEMPEQRSEGRARNHEAEERESHRLRKEQNNSLPDRPAHSWLPPREEPRISLQPTHCKMPPLLVRQRTSRIRIRLAERENRPTSHSISDNLPGGSEICFQAGNRRRSRKRGYAGDRLERQADGGRPRTKDEDS